MRLPKQDLIATALVAVAGVFYLLWVTGSAPLGLSSTRTTGLVVLALGFAASASAVVPDFDQLIHGNKAYLAVTSLIGVVALIAGVAALVAGSDTGLGVLMGAMSVLWLIATIHHSHLARGALPARRNETPRRPGTGPRAPASPDRPRDPSAPHALAGPRSTAAGTYGPSDAGAGGGR